VVNLPLVTAFLAFHLLTIKEAIVQTAHYKEVDNNVYVKTALDVLANVRSDQLTDAQRKKLDNAARELKELTQM
jgi:hypothetical protein